MDTWQGKYLKWGSNELWTFVSDPSLWKQSGYDNAEAGHRDDQCTGHGDVWDWKLGG